MTQVMEKTEQIDRRAIGRRLRALRTEAHKERATVADAIGVSVSAIAMYERGDRIPKDPIKKALAEYYGLDVQELFFID